MDSPPDQGSCAPAAGPILKQNIHPGISSQVKQSGSLRRVAAGSVTRRPPAGSALEAVHGLARSKLTVDRGHRRISPVLPGAITIGRYCFSIFQVRQYV